MRARRVNAGVVCGVVGWTGREPSTILRPMDRPRDNALDLPLDPDEWEVTSRELKRRLDAGQSIVLLDVREPMELEICRLPGSVHIPLLDLPSRRGEIEPSGDLVVFCHHGIRSYQATAYLRGMGRPRVWNLSGGIHEWALRIDPELRLY